MLASDGGAPAPRRPAARSSGLLASDGGAPAPRRPAARSSGLLAPDGGAPAPRRPAARTASWGEVRKGGNASPELVGVLLESACRLRAHPEPRRPDLARVN